MKTFSGDTKAVSVVIGALMLVLITVTAASAFAIFINQEQEERQKQQAFEQQQELENIRILSITPVDMDSDSYCDFLNFSISSAHLSTSRIVDIVINDQPLQNYNVTFQGESLPTPLNFSTTLLIEPREQITLHVNTSKDFFIDPFNISTTSYIKLTLFTSLGNTFEKTFYSPNAVLKLDLAHTPSLCDGTDSFCENEDNYIVQWHWTITKNSVVDLDDYGSTINYGFSDPATYVVTLEVIQNNGMSDISEYTFDVV